MSNPPAARAWRQVHFQRPLELDRVVGLLRQWAADERSPRLTFETRATVDGVSYLLGGEPGAVAQASRVMPQLLPGTTITDSMAERTSMVTAGHLKASTRHRALRPDDPISIVRAVLSALTQVRRNEQLVVQVLLGPRRVPLAVPTNSPSSVTATWYDVAWNGNGGTIDGEKRSALRSKVSDHGFACTIRLGVVASAADRRRTLLLGLLAALRTSESAGLQLTFKREPAQHLDAVRAPWRWPLRLNVQELAGLLAWPLGDDDLPGQPAAHPKRLPPAPGTTDAGKIVAVASAPGATGNLTITTDAALHHVHAVGPTGTGKSTVLGNLIIQDIAAGRAVVVIEPKGDLVQDVLERIPAHRQADVVVLDPLDDAPVGLTPFGRTGKRPELIADRLLTLMRQMHGSAIGPRSADILYASLLTLAHHDGASLVMLPLLLTNAGFRRSLTPSINDPISLSPFWAQYENWSDAERAAAIAPVMNKLRPLLRPNVRSVLGQRRPHFDVRQIFTEKRILLAPLQRGTLGPEAAALIGSLLVSELWQETLNRSSIPSAERHPVMVYIDEAQDFLRLPIDIGEALAQARGLGVGFTLAHQFMNQLPKELRSGVLANARNRIVFQLSDEDARIMSRGHDELSPADLAALGQYEVYASLFAAGRTTSYASGRTLPLPPPISNADQLRAASRAQFGRPLDEVEAGFAELLDHPTDDLGATGRRRRSAP